MMHKFLFTFFVSLGIVLLSCNSPDVKKKGNIDPESISAKPTLHKNSVDSISISYLLGQFDPAKDSSFVKVENKYTDRSDLYMHTRAYEGFMKMHEAALKDGVNLRVLSATRNFNSQKQIWEDKWNGRTLVGGKNLSQTIKDPVERALKILQYSSMPGTSRHHWGTDIDLNSLEPAYFNSGTGLKIYTWLSAHAAEYGFGQPYSAKDSLRPNGYNEEKWHWSFLPVSKPNLAAYLKNVSYEKIAGFAGSETAEKIGVIEKYVVGINSECK